MLRLPVKQRHRRSPKEKALKNARSCDRASCAPFGRARGPPARSRADGGPPVAAGRHTHEHPRWASSGRSWSPSGPIRLVQSPQSCPSMYQSEPRSFWSGPGGVSEVQGRRRSRRRRWPAHSRAPEMGLQRPLLVAIRADPPRSKPAKLLDRVPGRATHPLVGPGAASEVQGRRRSLRRCWPAHARAREVGPWRPRVVAIRDRAARGKAH